MILLKIENSLSWFKLVLLSDHASGLSPFYLLALVRHKNSLHNMTSVCNQEVATRSLFTSPSLPSPVGVSRIHLRASRSLI